MSIEPFVTQEYALIDAYEGVLAARQSTMLSKGIVVTELDKPIGLLTSEDLATRQYRIVIDCLTQKPVVDRNDRISDVLAAMENSGQNVLMVYDRQHFVGLISQNDILRHLQANLGLQKLKVQAAAHDLKNPLASIQMIASMLQDVLVLPKQQKLLDYLLQSCGHAHKIVEDILLTEQAAEKSLATNEENFDVVVEGCLEHFSIDLKKKKLSLTLQLNFGGTVMLDRIKLERAIHNLLSNAIKFSHEGGQISVETFQSGAMAHLIIRDSGIGIPIELHDRVFDRFTQARRPGTAGEPPTGLGMYITKQIVELHNGRIELNSDGKNGTAVSIRLQAMPRHLHASS